MADPLPFRRFARGMALASVLGSGLAGAAAGGVVVGVAIDRAMGWPLVVATPLFGLVGGVAGVLFVIRTLAAQERAERRTAGSGREDESSA